MCLLLGAGWLLLGQLMLLPLVSLLPV